MQIFAVQTLAVQILAVHIFAVQILAVHIFAVHIFAVHVLAAHILWCPSAPECQVRLDPNDSGTIAPWIGTVPGPVFC